MQLTVLFTALLSATTTLALPAPHIPDALTINTTVHNITMDPSAFANMSLTPRHDSDGEPWDKKKIKIWTYAKEGFSCGGHIPQSKHNLKPFKCKSFGIFDRFEEVEFELPKEVHEQGINCELIFWAGSGCDGDELARKSNANERPYCGNWVGNIVEESSCMPRCYKP